MLNQEHYNNSDMRKINHSLFVFGAAEKAGNGVFMNTVLMCGNCREEKTLNILLAFLNAVDCGAVFIGDETVSLIPKKIKQADFVIVENKHIKKIYTGNGVALFRKDFDGREKIEIPPSFLAVIDSDNEKAADMLKRMGISTITCGFSQKDTVTFSSLENDSAVVSLQRGITALDGSEVLPVDIPVALDPVGNEYQILAATAVLLLSGIPIPGGGIDINRNFRHTC